MVTRQRKVYASKRAQAAVTYSSGKEPDLSKMEEADVDDLVQAKKAKKVQRVMVEAAAKHEAKYAKPIKHKVIKYSGELPKRIEVKESQVGHIVPAATLRTGSFKFSPHTFRCHAESLGQREIRGELQVESLQSFLDNPRRPVIYGVGGTPDDSKARYFAAFLVAHHLRKVQLRAHVLWEVLYNGFDNPTLDKYSQTYLMGKPEPTMLVLTNLSPNSSATKLEKARDLLERFPNIPRVVVCSGEDPMSFVATRLYSPIHGLAYFSAEHYKMKIIGAVDEE